MQPLANHPGYDLNDDAAQAFDAAEAAHGKFTVTSAYRSIAQQQALINRWNEGGPGNRPPNLYRPAMPANASPHTKGYAIDIGNWQAFAAIAGQYGFTHPIPSDVVHFEFHGGGGGAPAASQTVKDEQAFLNAARGEHLTVDGVLGPLTKAAIQRYQTFLRSYGYTGAIDGLWGPGTQAAHAAYYAAWSAPATPPANPSGPLTYASIQAGLNKFGYGLVVDGKWGPKSHTALGDFQANHGLVVDYLVGPKTRAALGI